VIDLEPLPLTAADELNVKAVNAMLAIARGRAAHKREPWYKAAGLHLEMLRRGKTTEVWAEIVRKHVGLGLARAYELIELGSGRKTLAELRTAKRASPADRRQWKAQKLAQKRNPQVGSGA